MNYKLFCLFVGFDDSDWLAIISGFLPVSVESEKKTEVSAFSKVEKTGMIYLSEDITALGESPIELLF